MAANILRKGINLMEGKDNYDLNLMTSIQKAISKEEMPTKIKHVRSVIISTHHEKGGSTFWSVATKMPVQSQGPVCWKFCHVLHKLIREGHPNFIFDCMKFLTWLQDLGRVWSHLPENFGPLNSHYLKLLYSRLNFHKKHIKVPGNLVIKDDVIADLTGSDANGYFEFSVILLDLMDDVMNLQATVFHQMERCHDNSMTSSGQCKLYPLILIIQDSCQLYDLLVKLLFRLHKVVPADALSGHRERFLTQYKSLKQFYQVCGNLQYFRGLVQVPGLPELPPNFLIASEIFKHKKPVAVVAGEEPDDEPEPQRQPSPPPQPAKPMVETRPVEPVPDARDTVISQLRTQIEHLRNELEFVKTKAREKVAELNGAIDALRKQLEQEKKTSLDYHATSAALNRKLEESLREQEELKERLAASEMNAAAAASLSKAEELAKNSDEKFKKMREVYENLKQEHVTLLRTNAAIKKQATAEKQAKDELQLTFNNVKEQVELIKAEQNVMQETMQKSSDDSSRHTATLEKRIEELDAQKAEFEEKLMKNESETRSLHSKLAEYEASSSQLKTTLEQEKESKVHLSNDLEKRLKEVQGQLEEERASASSLDTKNLNLKQQLQDLEAAKASESQALSSKLLSLESSLASLRQERDQVTEEKVKAQADLESQIKALKELIKQKEAEELARRRLNAYGVLCKAVDKGVEELNSTNSLIGSEEFVSHTCSADSAVADLRRLDDELNTIYNEVNTRGDLYELSHHVHAFTRRICHTMEQSKAACNRAPPEQGDELSEKCNQLGADSIALIEILKAEYGKDSVDKTVIASNIEKVRSDADAMLSVARGLLIRGSDVNVDELGEMVEEELNATQLAIEDGASKIQAMLQKSRARDTGIKLEVNEKILDAVTRLMQEIQQLVRKSKDLQAEIVASGRGSASAKEFYKKNSRWTEGLVSAAKAVGWGASTLVEKAERIIEGKGTLNELKVCSHEIAASTAQLVVSSQVKAEKGSVKLADLKTSAKGVKSATADVVASSNFGEQMIEEADLMDFSNLSLTQTKRVEMNTQVYILELESKLVKERKKLSQIRQRHYQLAGESEGWECDEDGNLINIENVEVNGDGAS